VVGLSTMLVAGCTPQDHSPATALPGAAATPTASVGTSPSTGATASGPTGAPPMSTAVPALTRPPSGPPESPTDRLPTDWMAGTVTVGGSGPCYTVKTDDDTLYALYSTSGITLHQGDVVRIKLAPMRAQISCGSGRAASIVAVNVIG
jgi:hypothetical protein